MVSSTTVRIDWTIFMAEFNWNSIFWDPWISWRIKRFLSSNGEQEWVHKGPKFLTSIHKYKSWWTFENIYHLPYISWNCSQNVKIILSTASRQSFIQYNRCSCCKHITSGFNTYLYGCVSLLNNLYVVYLCVCVISNGSTCKKPHYLSDLAKLDTQQEQCGWGKKKMYRDFFIQHLLFYEKPLSYLCLFSNFV